MRWEYPWALLLLLVIPALWWHARRGGPRGRRPVGARGAWGVARRRVRAARARSPAVAGAGARDRGRGAAAAGRAPERDRIARRGHRARDRHLAQHGAEDFRPSNRLQVARPRRARFVRARKHDRLGLVGFAATAFTQCPLTLDHDALAELLEGLDFGSRRRHGDRHGPRHRGGRVAREPHAEQVVVLLTDARTTAARSIPSPRRSRQGLRGQVYTVLAGKGASCRCR